MRKSAVLILTAVLSFVFLFPVCYLGAKDNKQEEQAVASARSWLKLVDSGKYGEAWDGASEYLKGAVTRGDFIVKFRGVRKPLGRVINRSLLSATYTETLPGAPDSEYFVIQFSTEFENKKDAIETITPRKEKDGQWKVTGYFIR